MRKERSERERGDMGGRERVRKDNLRE